MNSVMSGPPDGLCLEFVNTVAWRQSVAPEERLPSPLALLDWCAACELLDAGSAARLRAGWEERPQEANTFHRRALALREAIYETFRSRIHSEKVPAEALRIVNAMLGDAPPRVRLAPSGDAIGWWVGSTAPASQGLLAPILWSAADLLTGPRAHRVRQCADERGCGWLFLDESRAGTRRWCSMGECGNRAKAHRHYRRARSARTEPGG
jgi:predicted RNA-binding Zn ribbon-like protein